MKKKFFIAALLLAVVGLFTACGNNKTKAVDFVMPEDFNGEAFYEKSIEIKFYHTMSVTTLQPTLEKYIAKFNELYPNIKVSHEAIGGYDDVRDQLRTEINANNQPNMAYCYPDHVALYNKAKSLVVLDDLINSTTEITRADGSKEILGLTEAQINDFIDGYYAEGSQFGDGKMYTLPFSKSTEVLYYNKTFFDAHDLEVPTTWTELYDLCKAIKEIDPKCIPLGYDSEANWFITMCEQYQTTNAYGENGAKGYTTANGDSHFLFNNQVNIDFVSEFAKWYNEGLVTTQTLSGGYTSSLFTTTPGENGLQLSTDKDHRSYMSIGSSAGATHQRPSKVEYEDDMGVLRSKYPFEVGIVSIPQINPATPKVISQGPSICIFKDNDPYKVIATWLFLKYLTTSVDFQVEFSQVSGYVPVLKSVNNNASWNTTMAEANGKDGIAALSAKVCMEQESAYFTSDAFIGSATARDQVGALMSTCLANGYVNGALNLEAIKKAFADAIDECEYAL